MTNTDFHAVTSYADFAAFAEARPQTGSTFKRITRVFDLIRQRRALARLDARLLADIGVSYKAAHVEARRLG